MPFESNNRLSRQRIVAPGITKMRAYESPKLVRLTHDEPLRGESGSWSR
jgi:hypothetical protein